MAVSSSASALPSALPLPLPLPLREVQECVGGVPRNGSSSSVGLVRDSVGLVRDASGDLQSAFMKFRSRRLTLKKQQASQASILYPQGSLHFREELRRRFVLQCKKYLGVPYAQRYHAEENCACDGCKAAGRNMYHDELFLDCCALVRRAVADLSTNFGFKLGPGNQACVSLRRGTAST